MSGKRGHDKTSNKTLWVKFRGKIGKSKSTKKNEIIIKPFEKTLSICFRQKKHKKQIQEYYSNVVVKLLQENTRLDDDGSIFARRYIGSLV